jgi:hypothetical protein
VSISPGHLLRASARYSFDSGELVLINDLYDFWQFVVTTVDMSAQSHWNGVAAVGHKALQLPMYCLSHRLNGVPACMIADRLLGPISCQTSRSDIV